VARIALGIDPGTARMGYAVVRQAAGELTLLACGAFETPSDLELARRLKLLYDGLIQTVDEYRPTELAV
jgi:crossover junction endodeoxyribonuclease RuvC